MPADFNITITGLAELQAKFERISGAALDEVIDRSLSQSGDEVLRQMQSFTPVDTGNLQASEFISKEGKSVFIGPDLQKAAYAPFVEYGFHHYISGKFIPGQHYVETTQVVMAPRIKEIFTTYITELLKS